MANAVFAGLGFLVGLMLVRRTPIEEANLVARFGDQYRDYMRRTGRYFPRWRAAASGAALMTLVSFPAGADPATADKSAFTLFRPTPPAMMREMSTDRPDLTESPYTVDAGHFQVEMDLVSYSYDRYNPARTDTRVETVGLATMNLKVGLCNQVDLQLVVSPYTRIRTDDRTAGTVMNQRGFGDLVTRLKWNLWGNDGGRTALALMPFVKFPTHHDDVGSSAIEGGLIVPLGVELPAGWGMGVMTEVDLIRDSASGGHHPEFVNTITFSHGIVGNLGGYVEFASVVSTEAGSDWVGTFDTGVTYALTDDIQLDAGVNIGLTRAADDWNPFVGVSWRF
jgi:hypothetical protein